MTAAPSRSAAEREPLAISALHIDGRRFRIRLTNRGPKPLELLFAYDDATLSPFHLGFQCPDCLLTIAESPIIEN